MFAFIIGMVIGFALGVLAISICKINDHEDED